MYGFIGGEGAIDMANVGNTFLANADNARDKAPRTLHISTQVSHKNDNYPLALKKICQKCNTMK